ncbi:hypothetical protein ACHWQZ_G011916 [Mnemiopsis leidyi]
MGRSKKIANGETTNEKILGKLPKSSQIKSNLANLDFDEDTIDGISILSFKAYDDLKEYYPIDKIQPNQAQDQPKRSVANKRKKCSEKGDKNKSRQVKKRPVIKQQGASNLPQFDKSESEPEEDQKNLLIKTEESPPPSPLPDIPQISTSDVKTTPTTPAATTAAAPSTPTIKSEGCSTSSVGVTVSNITPSIPAPLPSAPLPTTCGSGSPIYQPASQHLLIPLGKVPATPGSHPSRLPTPPSAGTPFYHGLPRQHPVAGSHPGLSFSLPHSQDNNAQQQQQQQHLSATELEMKLNAAKYDPRYLLPNGRFPHELSRYRSAEYEKYLAAARLHQAGSRPLFPPSATPRPPIPSTPAPVSHSIIASRNDHPGAASSMGSSGGTAIHRRLTEKKWNSIHVYIARLIYKKQQEAKDPLNGASVVGAGGESSARAFLTSGKREVSREYPSFAAGLHGLPPTPASPFSHGASNPFNPANKVHQSHHALGVREMQTLHGLGNRFPAPSIRPPYSGLAGSLYGHAGYDPLRHSISNYTSEQLSRLDQERLHQHLARTMYENSLRQHQAAAHREHEMQQQQAQAAMSREMLIHLEEQRRKLLQTDPQKLLPPSSLPTNIPDIYMRPQHLQTHLKYPGPGSSSSHGLGGFPNLFNRSLDPRARFSHLIPPKGPE